MLSTICNVISRTEQRTGERNECLENYRHVWQLNGSICAELRPVGHHRTVTRTHTHIHTKQSPQGAVIKAFMGIVMEG